MTRIVWFAGAALATAGGVRRVIEVLRGQLLSASP
jgi:hypothetical protein